MDVLSEHRKKRYVAKLKIEVDDGAIATRYTSPPLPYYLMQLFAVECAAGALFFGYRVVSLILEEVPIIIGGLN